LEFGTEIESLFNALFVVSNTKDTSWESLLALYHWTPETILKVEVGVDVCPVSSSME
jgi:hypothetical protein